MSDINYAVDASNRVVGTNADKSGEDVAAARTTGALTSARGLATTIKPVNPRPRKQGKDESQEDYMGYIRGWNGRGRPDESDQDDGHAKAMTSAMDKLGPKPTK